MQHLQNTQGVEAVVTQECRGRELSKLSVISRRNNQTYHKKGESSVTPRLMYAKQKEECRKLGYKDMDLVSSTKPLNQKKDTFICTLGATLSGVTVLRFAGLVFSFLLLFNAQRDIKYQITSETHAVELLQSLLFHHFPNPMENVR